MLSTIEAAKIIGCSRNHIVNLCESGALVSKWELWGGRRVRKIDPKSVANYARENADNRRIGREFYGVPNRKKIISRGYRMRFCPDHPRANCDGYVYEHTLIMEETLGRPLTAKETVHHIDRDKLNNSPENLCLYASRSEHMRMHAELRRAFLKAQSLPELEQAVIDLVDNW